MNKIFWIVAMAALLGSSVQAFDLTGDWDADGANIYIRQVNETIWWYAEDSAEARHGPTSPSAPSRATP